MEELNIIAFLPPQRVNEGNNERGDEMKTRSHKNSEEKKLKVRDNRA